MNSFEDFANEILEEIKTEEKTEEERQKAIVKNGCAHTEKIEKTSLVYKTKWLECAICGKQFNLNGTEI
jgi:hypothetical protein